MRHVNENLGYETRMISRTMRRDRLSRAAWCVPAPGMRSRCRSAGLQIRCDVYFAVDRVGNRSDNPES